MRTDLPAPAPELPFDLALALAALVAPDGHTVRIAPDALIRWLIEHGVSSPSIGWLFRHALAASGESSELH